MSMERGIGDLLGRLNDLERQVERLQTIEAPGGGVEYLYARTVLGGSLAPIDFVRIPQTGRRLILRWSAKSDLGAVSNNALNLQLSSNTTATPTPDTGNNYCWTYMLGSNSGISSSGVILTSSATMGYVGGAASPSNDYLSPGRVEIMDYTHASHLKMFTNQSYHHGTTSLAASYDWAIGGDWHGSSINQVRFALGGGGQFVAGSIFEVWIG